LRVLLVTHYYPARGGGVERVALQLALRLRDAGLSLTWCASDTEPPPQVDGIAFEPMRTVDAIGHLTGFPYPLWTPAALARLARHVRNADALHVHDAIYFGCWVATLLARRAGRPWVVTQHIGDVPMRPPLRWAYSLANRAMALAVLKPARAVGFISPQVLRHFEGLVGPQGHFRYLANGVDGSVFQPSPEEPAVARAALGFEARRPLLLFVGRFAPVKRLSLLRALAMARPAWQFCVIGHGPERPEDWKLPNVVVLSPKPQAELARWYQAADLLVLPSASEGFPLVVQEAMACGTPACMSGRVAAGSTVPPRLWVRLEDGGDLFVPNAVVAIERHLALDASQRRRLSADCTRFARETWSWEAMAQQHRSWFEGVQQ
jgi:glycosyltransferase involved in cell wall biosynthesis